MGRVIDTRVIGRVPLVLLRERLDASNGTVFWITPAPWLDAISRLVAVTPA